MHVQKVLKSQKSENESKAQNYSRKAIFKKWREEEKNSKNASEYMQLQFPTEYLHYIVNIVSEREAGRERGRKEEKKVIYQI